VTAPASGAAPRRRDGPLTVALVILGQASHGLCFGGIALFLPLIREDLAISFEQAGMLSAATTLTYALGQIPAGYLSDRFGPKRLFFIGLLGFAVLAVAFGLVRSFEMALATQLASGVFRSLLFAPGLSLIASWFPPNRRATAMGLFVIGGFLGNIVLSLIGPMLAGELGWRIPFVAFAVVTIAAAFVYLFFGREPPRSAPRQEVGMFDAFQMFRYPIMWVCAALQFIRFGVVTSFNFWLPSLLVSDRGLSLQAAGYVTAMAAALTGFSNAFGGYASDRMKNPPLVIGGSLAVLALTSMLIVLVESIPLLVLVIAVNAVFLQFYFGPLFHVPVEVLGQRVTGMSAGFSNLFANIGAFMFAYALGVVKDREGAFTLGFMGITVACVAGIALTFVLAGMRKTALAGATP
jgi:sugar phosphate permease